MSNILSFQFLYSKKYDKENHKEFYSKKSTLKDAMDDFLTRKKNLYDIDSEVDVTYKDGSSEMVQVEPRQDWDGSWYFIHEGQMICGNGYSCEINRPARR